MIELGTTDINKLYLGGTEINKCYLGSTLVFETSSAPTDAEIYFRFQDSLVDATGNHSTGGNAQYSYVTGLYGSGRAIDANINGLITIADSDNLSFTDGTNDLPFSVAFAVKLDTLGVAQFIVTKQLLAGGFNREYDVLISSDNRVGLYCRDASGNANHIKCFTNSQISLNTTAHIVLTYDGSASETGINCYFNGVLGNIGAAEEGTYNGMANTSADTTLLSLNGGNGLRGALDYFAIYRRELSATEVTSLYNLNSAGTETI